MKKKGQYEILIIPHQQGGSVRRYRLRSSLLRGIFFINALIIAILVSAFYLLWTKPIPIQPKTYHTDYVATQQQLNEVIGENNQLQQKLGHLENQFQIVRLKMLDLNNYYHRLKQITDQQTTTLKQNSVGGISYKGDGYQFTVDLEKMIRQHDPLTPFLGKKLSTLYRIALLNATGEILVEEIKKLNNNFISSYGYIFERSDMLLSTPSIWPVRGWVSSEFGPRKDPFGQMTKFHHGIDIANNPGSVIKASAKGVVHFSGTMNGYGNVIVIDHGYNIQTRYAHLQKRLVKKNQVIKKGEKIGHLGNTGRSSGPHLHYEVRINDIPVNPRRYFLD